MRKNSEPDEVTKDERALKRIDDELKILQDTQSEISKKITEYSKQKEQVLKRILAKSPNKIDVTDHAIVRYVERVYKMDTETLKNEIVTNQLKENALQLGGNGNFYIDGIKYVLKDYKVITIISKK